MNYKGFYLVRKWPYHVLNYLNNINMLEFREALFGKGRLGGILQIGVFTILRLLITVSFSGTSLFLPLRIKNVNAIFESSGKLSVAL